LAAFATRGKAVPRGTSFAEPVSSSQLKHLKLLGEVLHEGIGIAPTTLHGKEVEMAMVEMACSLRTVTWSCSPCEGRGIGGTRSRRVAGRRPDRPEPASVRKVEKKSYQGYTFGRSRVSKCF